MYLHGRQHSQHGIHTQGGVGASVGREGRGGSTATEVSTSLHIEELQEGVVLQDSTDKHAKQLELGSGGIQSIHCYTENPPAHPPLHPLMSYPSPQGKVHPQHPLQPGAP